MKFKLTNIYIFNATFHIKLNMIFCLMASF